jgi:hypothetical protein
MIVATLLGTALPEPAAAQGKARRVPPAKAPESTVPKADAKADDSATAEPAPPAAPPAQAPSPLPGDAAAALVRAVAAYEYGDMNQVVEAARPVAEGLWPASPEQQNKAFRLLGIGLYLTNRPLGAEIAFTELLRRDPAARLDPTTTRPELVAFFESLRYRQLNQQRSARKAYWNFLPPVGQFQNGDTVKGWLIVGIGIASVAELTTSGILLYKWRGPNQTSTHSDAAEKLQLADWVALGVLSATYLYGVIDGFIGYGRPLEESKPAVSLFLLPGGGGLGFTF